ncbi:MAG: hypothetical protein PUE01_02370 [Clostridiaceae bacterium]|nr:hypothetical protein [Clostridiaceae bacterium]
MRVIAKPIEMVAWFENEGRINPVRFRLEDENEKRVIKIDKVLKREKEKLAGNPNMVFTCTSNVDGVEKIFEVKYEINTFKWILFKM